MSGIEQLIALVESEARSLGVTEPVAAGLMIAALQQVTGPAEPVRVLVGPADEIESMADEYPPRIPVNEPRQEAERLNTIAGACTDSWGWLPLSVRYGAARAADEQISAWFASVGEPASPEPPPPEFDWPAVPESYGDGHPVDEPWILALGVNDVRIGRRRSWLARLVRR